MKTCSVESCDKKHEAKGYCSTHYKRLKTTGKINNDRDLSDFERFLTKFKKNNNGCWEWSDSLTDRGYGQFGAKGTTIRAHRFSYENYIGLIPNGMIICHKCDNPPCVNPDHLFLGTHKINSVDRENKGRRKISFGEESTNSKLNNNTVTEIKNLLKLFIPIPEISKLLNVNCSTIKNIKSGRNWSHI